ncbi:MAG: periplasmic heavy metal sensor [Bauldia sp.]
MTVRGPFAIILVVVAALSLATNFLILGFVAARVSDFRHGAVERLVAIGARSFPGKIRDAIIAEAAEEKGPLRAALFDLRTARQTMFAAMRAEPFDPAALDRAFADVRAKTATLQSLGQALVGEAVAAAPPGVRQQIEPPGWLR